MELYDHIRKISFAFFAVFGMSHFIAGLLFVNGYAPETTSLINRILFIPFVLAAVTYLLGTIRFQLFEYGKTDKGWDYGFLSLGVAVFLVLLAVELLVQDSACPLSPFPC